MRSAPAGPDADGLFHWSRLGDDHVDDSALWAVTAALVCAAADLGARLPDLGWFSAESLAERAYVELCDGDRPWDDFTSDRLLGVVVDYGRGAVGVNAGLDAPGCVAAVRRGVAALAQVSR